MNYHTIYSQAFLLYGSVVSSLECERLPRLSTLTLICYATYYATKSLELTLTKSHYQPADESSQRFLRGSNIHPREC